MMAQIVVEIPDAELDRVAEALGGTDGPVQSIAQWVETQLRRAVFNYESNKVVKAATEQHLIHFRAPNITGA